MATRYRGRHVTRAVLACGGDPPQRL